MNKSQLCYKNPRCDHTEEIFTDLFLNRSNVVLNSFGPKLDEFLMTCTIANNYTCNNMFMYQLRNQNLLSHKCASMQSIWGKPEEDSKINREDYYAIYVDIHEEDYFMVESKFHLVYFYLHNPYALANPFEGGMLLKAGYQYIISMNVEERETLPAPFKSNCTDYITAWRKNGGRSPTTRNECLEKCQLDLMFKELGCVASYILYPNDYDCCEDFSIRVPPKIKNICSLHCGDPCLTRDYILELESSAEIEDICHDPLKCGAIYIQLRFMQTKITKFKDEAKFMEVELYSNIGGYMGMWLGISLVSLFDLAEMLMEVAIYPLRRTKRVSKQVVRVF